MSAPNPQALSFTPRYFLTCIAGPDHGKRLALAPTELVLGRAATSNLRSDDPEVTDRFASFQLEGSRLRVRGLSDPLPYVDGHPTADALLSPGQQVRLGRSLWMVAMPGSGQSVFGLVSKLGDEISSIAGLEKPSEWHPAEMFSQVIRRHKDEEVEAYFTVGTHDTTPALLAIDTNWPKPWMFVRVLAMSLLLYLGFLWIFDQFNNIRLVPGLIMTGSVAVPFALLLFFFEANAPRNISLYQVIKLVLLGGLVSIVISLFLFKLTGLTGWLGAAGAGIVEESGKALTLLIVISRPRYRWTLNGLLLGAAVGTGFAVFESAGYALDFGVSQGVQAMKDTILTRGVLTVFGGHTIWTGLAGAALWRARGTRPFRPQLFLDPMFLRVFIFCIGIHMLWNAPFQLPAYGKYILLGIIAWFLVLEFIQAGLKQIKTAQVEEVTAGHATPAPG